MIRQVDLIERVRHYDPGADEDLINRAYVFSMKAHGAQRRASGDPYFSHPLEVAGIVTEMRLDAATVATALLHDTVEDTVATLDQIDQQFGSEVAQLVDGVTKLSKLEAERINEQSRAGENFRKLLLAMSHDLRVLLVKLADRLHNMRTLQHIKDPAKRRRIALETSEIYGPLAERIGLHEVKDELQDLAFSELNVEARNSVLTRLEFLRTQGGDLVSRIAVALDKTLRDDGVAADVTGREKRPYSIWRKMQRKNVSFEELSDVMAFRVIVDSEGDCYRALGVVHRHYRMVPDRFKDYISTPKPNNYRSLHTTVIGPERRRIEVQIRSRAMHEVAEYGVAAHWQYKVGAPSVDGGQYRWIRELLEILEHGANPDEFLEHTKLEMFQDQVFCFTPKGDLIALPRGATPVDFAYAVHTEVGDTCVGCKINGRIAPLRMALVNGDQVEIIRSKAQTPSPTWENFVTTGKARSAIRRFVRTQRLSQYVDLGRSILERSFEQAGHELNDKAIERALTLFQVKEKDDLYATVGEGLLAGKQVLDAVFPGEKEGRFAGLRAPSFVRSAINRVRSGQIKGGDHAIPIKGLIPGVAVHMAECCHPLPGDRIVGIVATGKGVTVHTIDCESLEAVQSAPERWLDVSWDAAAETATMHVGRIEAVLANEPGALNAMTGVIAKNMGNISNLRIENRTPDFFEIVVDIEVTDVKHLADISAALRAAPQIHSVNRVRG
ncbi:MAG: bifunctional (p)ppGpp synthetase/guanosine-3',5'-bis(diphosphate) 3'-pyrophosphohydrolase [Alphaproteobacteria bacterium]|nr:bifunctional (p)ppGpp synthetase/guanosine-3',5'-bis(diphosphate) 3'-pyrophosphohydrolase [Alphaproteobacteria bacterium]